MWTWPHSCISLDCLPYLLPAIIDIKTILLHTVNDALLASDSGKVLLPTFLFAAFNTIDRTILLTHIEYTFGIHSTALAWFALSVWLVPKSVCQQQAVQSCQTALWHPSRLCHGACPLHPLYYPSSLHHQPSQLESPLPCWRHSTTSQRLTRKHPLCSENHICYSDIKNWTTQNKLQLNSEINRSNAPWNKTRTVFYFCQYPSAWRYHSPSLRFCQKPQVFSSTARCPWKTSSVKPPNPAITSSVN